MVLLVVRNWTKVYPQDSSIEGEFETVGQVKDAIFKLTGITNGDQLLIYKKSILNDEDSNIANYNIQNLLKDDLADYNLVAAEVINLYKKLQLQMVNIYIEWKGKTYAFNVSSEDTVLSIKMKFDKRGGGVPPHRQVLRYQGNAMDDNDPLSDYLITEDCAVLPTEIAPDPEKMVTVNVIVRSTGNRKVFEVEENDTLHTLLAKVREEGLADNRKCDFEFYYGGYLKSKKHSIGYYCLKQDECLWLVYRD